MKNKQFNRYYLLCCIGVLIASYYPLSMAVQVITDMITNGTVPKENYPKYIIPYSPMCVAIITGVLVMPLCLRLFQKFSLAVGASVATGVFFTTEFLFEQKVVVSTAETIATLENWQMSMCYVPPEGWGQTVTTYKTQTAVDILLGDYHPAFKLHFYLISVVLILTVLNCLYGFGQMVKTGERKRFKALILQSVCSLTFLALCILACFTAFWRDGSIRVSTLSAALMTVFFVLLGVTAGVFGGSFLLGKRKLVSVWLPAISASVMTLLMYIGEMILLNGHLYILGTGFLFDSLPGIRVAPIDVLAILLSGCITGLVFTLLNMGKDGFNAKQAGSAVIFSGSCAVITIVIILALWVGGLRNGSPVSKTENAYRPDEPFRTVQVLETTTDNTASNYEVGTYLNGTDFSSIGQVLAGKITQEWKTYAAMTQWQRLTSSHLWGLVSLQIDTWEECEEAIGLEVNNPLETMDWLNKTGYFGMESVEPTMPAKHIKVSANAPFSTDRKVREITITAGYCVDDLQITLNATLCADSGPYQTGSGYNGYATFEEKSTATGSGIPVLIITTMEANNNGYYHADYFDPTAYWVDDHVFYTLRILGDEANKDRIQTTLSRILAEI